MQKQGTIFYYRRSGMISLNQIKAYYSTRMFTFKYREKWSKTTQIHRFSIENN
jgi:hypothetical protein